MKSLTTLTQIQAETTVVAAVTTQVLMKPDSQHSKGSNATIRLRTVHEESCDEYCCDEQDEDSSGYYSSYHSVDLVSSSGGRCVGGHQILRRQLRAMILESGNEHWFC